MMSGSDRRWYTVAEAATLLGMTKQTLWRRIREGILPLPTVDGRLVVPAARIEQLRASGELVARAYNRRPRGGGWHA